MCRGDLQIGSQVCRSDLLCCQEHEIKPAADVEKDVAKDKIKANLIVRSLFSAKGKKEKSSESPQHLEVRSPHKVLQLQKHVILCMTTMASAQNKPRRRISLFLLDLIENDSFKPKGASLTQLL